MLYPLTAAQKRFWFMSQFFENIDTYNMSLGLTVNKNLNFQKILNALFSVVKKNPILTASIIEEQGQVYQRLNQIEKNQLPLTFVDLTSSENNEKDKLFNILKENLQKSFVLKQAPLWRLVFIKLNEKQVYLFLVMHHVITDAWSFSQFFRELSDHYLKKEKNDLINNYFLEHAFNEEQKYFENTRSFKEDLMFWQEYLSKSIDKIQFVESSQFGTKSFSNAAIHRCHFSYAKLQEIRQFAAKNNTTTFIILLAAYGLLLFRSTELRNCIIGTMVSGREALEDSKSLGCYANVLPLILSLSFDQTVEQYIKNITYNWYDVIEHQRLPFQNILDEYRKQHRDINNQIFETLFVMQNNLGEFKELFGDAKCSYDEYEQPRNHAEFPLFFLVRESERGLFISLQYDQEKFTTDHIEKFLFKYQKVIEDLINNKKSDIKDFLCADADEKKKIEAFNDTQINYATDKSVYELFLEIQAQCPEKIAVCFDDNKYSYQDLADRTNQIANFLHEKGVIPRKFIGVCLPRSVDLIASILAIWRLSCAYVPLDPSYPRARLQTILSAGNTHGVVVDHKTLAILDNIANFSFNLNELSEKNNSVDLPTYIVDPELPVYRLFTSGSTGQPKTVTVFQYNLLNLFYWAKTFFSEAMLDGFMAGSSINFDASIIELFVPLIAGGKVILGENVLHYHDLISKNEVITLAGTPSAIQKLIRQAPLHESVKALFVSGEVLTSDLVENLFKFPHVENIINGYGLTEVTAYSAVSNITRKSYSKTGVNIGKPIANNSVHILNENLLPVPIGAVGEIYLGGKGIPFASNFNNQLEFITIKNLVPKASTDKFYKTGDLGFLSDKGYLVCLGRKDTQIKLRGYRIEQTEIEKTIRSHAFISEAVVILKVDEKLEQILVCYYISQGNRVSPLELREHVIRYLPMYMVPSFFVSVENLPTNNSGKIDRKLVAQLPHLVSKHIGKSSIEASINELHQIIINVWEQVLGVNNINPDDSFFLLGGHSLLLPQVSSLLAEKLNKKIPIANFFLYPTVQELADSIGSQTNTPTEHTSILSVTKNDDYDDSNFKDDDIAIIGVAQRLPMAENLDSFWQILVENRSTITEIPFNRWKITEFPSPTLPEHSVRKMCHWGAFLKDVKSFDPVFFGISPREAKIMDPQQRLLLEVAWEVLELAGYSPSWLAKENKNVGVYVGASLNDYALLLIKAGLSTDPYYASGNSFSLLANRISYLLGLNGSSLTVDTACSSSFTALHLAVNSLRNNELDYALVGTTALMLAPDNYVIWNQMGILAEAKDSAAFDENASGFIPGEAVVTVLLKNAKQAVKDKDNIWGIIKGTAVNHDGRSKVGLNATSPKAQAELIMNACKDAGIEPESLDYIETHGTGTRLGDAVEFVGLSQALKNNQNKLYPIGSIKSQVGHTGPAAGLVSLIKVLLAFKNKLLPASRVHKLNSEIQFNTSQFFLNTKILPWVTNHLKLAGISAFGFGGSNSHVVIQEYCSAKTEEKLNCQKELLFVLSAKTENALYSLVENYIQYVSEFEKEYSLASICYTLGIGREHFDVRLALIVKDFDQLLSKLNHFYLKRVPESEKGIFFNQTSKKTKLVENQESLNLNSLAETYVNGFAITWEILYKNLNVQRLPLLTYPFQRMSCWFSSEFSISNDNTNLLNKSWLHYPKWDNKILDYEVNALNIVPVDLWIIFITDDNVFNNELIKFFQAKKLNFRLVYLSDSFKNYPQFNENYQISSDNFENYHYILQQCSELSAKRIHCIYLASSFEASEPYPATKISSELKTLFYLIKALSIFPNRKQFSVQVITNNTQPVFESDEVNFSQAPLWGMFKSANIELPDVFIQGIDLSVKDLSLYEIKFLVEQLCQEALFMSDLNIAYRKNSRYVLNYDLFPSKLFSSETNLFEPNQTYLITGGLGALGTELAKWLAEQVPNSKIILIGRKINVNQKIENLINKRFKIELISADITDNEQMANLVKDLTDRYGLINAVFHLAGEIEPALIKDKAWHDYEKVLSAKVIGAQILSQIFAKSSETMLIFYSSLAANLGAGLLSDYSAANLFLESYAEYLSKTHNRKVIAINWCGWQEVGIGTALNGNKITLITTKDALELLPLIVRSKKSSIIVAHPDSFSNASLPKKNRLKEFFPKNFIQKEELSSMKSNNWCDWLATQISHFSELPLDAIDLNQSFLDFGVDSILSAQLTIALNKETKLKLTPAILFEYPSIKKLAEYIETELAKLSNYTLANEQANAAENVQSLEDYTSDDIAIIGISCALPEAPDIDSFWENLLAQKDSIVQADYKNLFENKKFKFYNQNFETNHYSAGFLNFEYEFDAELFKIAPIEANRLQEQQKLFLQLAFQTIEMAGYTPEVLQNQCVGVFVGAMPVNISSVYESINQHTLLAQSNAMLANRVSYFFNFSGPSVTIDTLCSSSLVALHMAIQSIRNQECDMALVGGIRIGIEPEYFQAANEMKALSPTGKCKSFSKYADGFVPGEGGGVLLIKPMHKAKHDGDTIWAVIKGSAINHGGKGNGLTAPNPKGQAEVIKKALKNAKVLPESITYIEAHGTGTELGDPIEVIALNQAYSENHMKKQYCGLGSVKSNIGHLEPAAGLASLIKVILSLKNKKLPASLYTEQVNQHIDLSTTPFYLIKNSQDWVRTGNHPRRAGISSFGIGGTNAHVILEESIDNEQIINKNKRECLFLLSAKNQDALLDLTQNYINFLDKEEVALTDMSYTLCSGRSHYEHRLAVLAANQKDLLVALRSFINKSNHSKVLQGEFKNYKELRVVLDFKISQSISLYLTPIRELYRSNKYFAQMIENCHDLLQSEIEQSLLPLILDPKKEVYLSELQFYQPVLFCIQYGIVKLLDNLGVKFKVISGTNITDYVALCFAKILSFKDALLVVSYRAKLLQSLYNKIDNDIENVRTVYERFLSKFKLDMLETKIQVSQPTKTSLPLEDIVSKNYLVDSFCNEILGLSSKPNYKFSELDTISVNLDDEINFDFILAQLYVKGSNINWDAYYFEQPNKKRIPLPGYPFKLKKLNINNQSKDIQMTSDIIVNPVEEVSELKKYLKSIVADSLQMEESDIDENRSLLELGADSLNLAGLISYINERFGTNIRMLQVFEEITNINLISNYIEKHAKVNI